MQVPSSWIVLLPGSVYFGIVAVVLWYLSTCSISHLKPFLSGIVGFWVVEVLILFNNHQSQSAFYLNLVVFTPAIVLPILVGAYRLIKAKRPL
jgi:hypothetical protein